MKFNTYLIYQYIYFLITFTLTLDCLPGISQANFRIYYFILLRGDILYVQEVFAHYI